MDEHEENLEYFRSMFVRIVERIDTMTAREAIEGLREVKAARQAYKAEFAARVEALLQSERPQSAWPVRDAVDEFAYLSSLHTFLNSVHAFNEKRAQAGAKTQQLGPVPFTDLERALQERLDSLNNRPETGGAVN